MKYVVVEQDKKYHNNTVFGPFESYGEARIWCHGRIELAIQEDWGQETTELVTDMWIWTIKQIIK